MIGCEKILLIYKWKALNGIEFCDEVAVGTNATQGSINSVSKGKGSMYVPNGAEPGEDWWLLRYARRCYCSRTGHWCTRRNLGTYLSWNDLNLIVLILCDISMRIMFFEFDRKIWDGKIRVRYQENSNRVIGFWVQIEWAKDTSGGKIDDMY